jgi:hypothetical protein
VADTVDKLAGADDTFETRICFTDPIIMILTTASTPVPFGLNTSLVIPHCLHAAMWQALAINLIDGHEL